jgi:hypothetical protein
MKILKNNFIILLKILTIALITFLTLYRFKVRMPKEIFSEPNYYHFCIYMIILPTNVIFCCLLYASYKEYKFKISKKSKINLLLENINHWMDDSYRKVMDLLMNLPKQVSYVFARITTYYIKIPLISLKIIAYVPRVLLLVAMQEIYLNIPKPEALDMFK